MYATVKVKASPFIHVPESSVEAREGDEVALAVKCNQDATATWIFEGQLINTEKDNQFVVYTEADHSSGKRIEKLIIKHFKTDLEGIYTVEVEEDDCVSTRTIYVSSVK